jgi:hypothetical protein
LDWFVLFVCLSTMDPISRYSAARYRHPVPEASRLAACAHTAAHGHRALAALYDPIQGARLIRWKTLVKLQEEAERVRAALCFRVFWPARYAVHRFLSKRSWKLAAPPCTSACELPRLAWLKSRQRDAWSR